MSVWARGYLKYLAIFFDSFVLRWMYGVTLLRSFAPLARPICCMVAPFWAMLLNRLCLKK